MEQGYYSSISKKENSFNPKIVIFIFLLIILIIPFYESKRVIIWETQRKTHNEYALADIFRSTVLVYAHKSEEIKSILGLDNFFEKEHHFWLKIKKSPLVFQGEHNLNEAEINKNTEEERTEKETEENSNESEKENITNNKEQITKKKEEPIKKPEIKLPPNLDSPFRILIIGDSFIAVGGGVGDILERGILNSYKDTLVARIGKVSSGLSRPDYFNWNLKLKELIFQYQPNIAIIMLGNNDAQALTTPQGKFIIYYGEITWNEKYANRVSNFLTIFEENDIAVFWIGLPIMRSESFSKKMKNLNSIYEEECYNHKEIFIPTWDLFADEQGNYTAYLPDENGKYILVRASDGIHLQYAGGKMIEKEVFTKMEEVLELEQKNISLNFFNLLVNIL